MDMALPGGAFQPKPDAIENREKPGRMLLTAHIQDIPVGSALIPGEDDNS